MKNGIICPNCGGRGSDVVDSRPTAEGPIRRRRSCRKCRRRYSTVEIVVGDSGGPESYIATAADLKLVAVFERLAEEARSRIDSRKEPA